MPVMQRNDADPLHRIVYVSTSVNELSNEELQQLLLLSRRNNSVKNITGGLIYNDGNILQVLEGGKKEIHELFGTITQDGRHYGCIILQDTPSETRSFPDWSMGFKAVSHIEFIQLEGFWDIRNRKLPLINDESEDTIRQILNMFIAQNR